MTEETYFSRFQSLCLFILAQSDNCQESQDLFRAATTVPELVAAWQKFWAGLLHEVPELVIKAFNDFYPTYRSDLHRAGIFYNEDPAAVLSSSLLGDAIAESEAAVSVASPAGPSSAMVLIGDSTAPLSLTGRYRVYVLGSTPLTCADHCNVHVNSPRANVTFRDHCRANVEAGSVTAHDRCIINGRGDITCHDSTTIYLMGGTLHDHGHYAITAYNDAVIHSFTSKKITLHDHAQLIIA